MITAKELVAEVVASFDGNTASAKDYLAQHCALEKTRAEEFRRIHLWHDADILDGWISEIELEASRL